MKTAFEKLRIPLGVVYVLTITYLLFFAYFRGDTLTSVNLIPFKTLYTDIKLLFSDKPSVEFVWYIIGTTLGNIALLLPIPLLFNLKWTGIKKWLFIMLTPLCIEVMQFLLQVGSADIDDVILNATGCWIGFGLAKN